MKLTKAQGKKLQSIVGNGVHKDWYMELEQFLSDELARQKKEIIEEVKEAEEAGDQYGTLYELLK